MYIAPQTREEDATSIDAAMAIRDEFAYESPAMRALFDALVELLNGEGRSTRSSDRDVCAVMTECLPDSVIDLFD